MATTQFALSILTDYTNATEATLATSLSGQSAGSAVIYNTDLGKVRIWDGAAFVDGPIGAQGSQGCLLYTSPSPRDRSVSRMPSSA